MTLRTRRQLTFSRPACRANNADCDWLLQIEKTGACPSAVALPGLLPEMIAWDEVDPSTGASTILVARASDPMAPISFGGDEGVLQLAPRVSKLGGKDLVVWQADRLDGSLFGIFGALVGSDGAAIGSMFKINSYTGNDQREPAVAGAPNGEALAVWSSFGQDGDRGGIFGRRLSTEVRSDDYLRLEVEISAIRGGHQQHPQVVADHLGYWVAWETLDDQGVVSSLSIRRVDLAGAPAFDEVRIVADPGKALTLITLDQPASSQVAIQWHESEVAGQALRELRQLVGPVGLLGDVVELGGVEP